MAAVNQRIPNFLGGISQQPDFIKFPGQVRTCDNAYPDVTFGLSKRAPGEFVSILSNATADGKWFEILRDNDEKYLVQIQSSGIRVWDLATGTEQTVNFGSTTSNYNYLTDGSPSRYGIQSIGDYTIITNPVKTVATARTTSNTFGSNYAFVTVDAIAYNTEYVIGINTSSITSSTKRIVKSLSISPDNFDDGAPEVQYAGKAEFFNSSWGGVKYAVAVNGFTYVSGYQNNPDTNAEYDTRYSVEVVLQDGGLDAPATGTQTISIAGRNYTVSINDTLEYQSYADANAAFYRTPKNPDEGLISVNAVLGGLKDSLLAVYPTLTVEIIGNGLFIQSSSSLNVTTRAGTTDTALSVITSTAQNISKLPSMCKDGYICKVSNTDQSEADDYYVKFIAESGTSGSGVWEETVAPGIDAGFDYDSMPHALINNRDGTFTFSKLDDVSQSSSENFWKDRAVGDAVTNPMPTFVGQSINDIFFFNNRLGFITNENVVLSQPADYFNFFVNSAITVSAADPIDIAASDVKPAFLNHAVPFQKGVVLFSENSQFMLFSDAVEFSANTAQLRKLSSYECSPTIPPVDMGTSLMFTTDNTSHTKAFEMAIEDESAPPIILEQTRVIPELIPNSIDDVSNSAQNGLITYGKIDDSSLYFYKYYNTGRERAQSAWFTWTINGQFKHSFYTEGDFFTVSRQGTETVLLRYELIPDTTAARSYQVGVGTSGSPLDVTRRFEASLDNMFVPQAGDKSVTDGDSTITLPYTIQNNGDDLILVVLSGSEAGYVASPDSVSGTQATFNNIDVTGVNVAVGYKYTTEVQLPTYYYSVGQNQYDIDGDLRINRMNFELGISGPIEFHLEAPQTDTYIQYETGVSPDITSANTTPSRFYKSVKVPIYKKNEKYTLTIKIPDPFVSTIVSASWDGRYDNRRHVRR